MEQLQAEFAKVEVAEGELAELRDALAQAEHRAEETSATRDVIQGQLEDSGAEAERLIEAGEALEAQLGELREQLDDHQSQLEEAQQEAHQLAEQLEQAQTQARTELQEQQAQSEAALAELQEQLEETQQEAQAATQRAEAHLDSSKQSQSELADALAQARTEAEQAQQRTAELEAQAGELDEQLANMQSQLDDQRAEAERAASALDEANEEARRTAETDRTEITQAQARCVELEERLGSTQDRLDELEVQLEAQASEAGQLEDARARVAVLEAELATRPEPDQVGEAQAASQARIAELEADLVQARQDLSEAFTTFRTEAIQAATARDEAFDRVAELEAELEQASQARAQPAASSDELERQAGHIALLEGMLEAAQQQLDELQDQVSAPPAASPTAQVEPAAIPTIEALEAILLANRDHAREDAQKWKDSEVAIGRSIKELLALAHRMPQHLDEVYRVLGALQDIMDSGKKLVRSTQDRADQQVQALGDLLDS